MKPIHYKDKRQRRLALSQAAKKVPQNLERKVSMDKRLVSNHGLSLIEVLVSLLIFSIAILGLAPLMVVSMKSNSYSRDLSLATQLAKEKLEDYEAADSLPTVPYSTTESNVENKFTRAISIIGNSSDTLIPPSCYRVDVVVSWEGDDDLSHSTQMSTIVGKG